MKSDPTLILHQSINSATVLGRVQREVYSLDTVLGSGSNRRSVGNIRVSEELDNLIKANGVDLANDQQRQLLRRQLDFVRRTAPVVRMVFASQPGQREISMVVKWFREFGHPNTLLEVSVDPAIGGGCLLSTATKSFDFSYGQLLRTSPLSFTSVQNKTSPSPVANKK